MKNLQEMDYSTFVGLINERNRPSGGIKTIQEVIVNTHIDKKSKVLEIGSNTGFTTVNLALLSGATVFGIDIISESVEKSKIYASEMGAKTANFIHGTALNLPFKDEEFDLVWCSNVTSFIENKDEAISEYLRVLKQNGYLAVVPIYYRKAPPIELLNKVSGAINCSIEIWDKKFWVDLFQKVGDSIGVGLEVFYSKDYKYLNQNDRLEKYIDNILDTNLPRELKAPEKLKQIKERATYFYTLFNENNYKYAGYSTILMQKRLKIDEEELFLSEEI